MTATPKNATFTFVGLQTGKTYNVDVYCSDVANALATWSIGARAGTGTPNDWIAPEAVQLLDVSIETGMADTKALQLVLNQRPTGDLFHYVLFVSTSPRRPAINIRALKGSRWQAIQLA